MAHRITVEIRCRTRLAVWCFSFQIGRSTPMTSAGETWSTRFRPIMGNAYIRRVDIHWPACLSVQFGWCIANTLPAAFSNVGIERCRALLGSPPDRATLRLAKAASRASASVTRRTGPSPSSRRLPWMNNPWIHCL